MIVIPSLATSRDVILHAPRWRAGAVSRADRVLVTPGGKPLNVARVLGAMGVPCAIVLVADAALASDAAATLGDPVRVERIVTVGPSRTDVAIVGDEGELTVINGPPPELRPDELDGAIGALARLIGADDVVVIAGSQPAGAFQRLVALAQQTKARLVLDVSGPDLRAAASIPAALVKVNAAELAGAFAADADRASAEERAWSDGRSWLPAADNVVVTRGPAGIRAWLRDMPVVGVPALPGRVVNPYGAGDAVTAALTAGLAGRGIDAETLLEASAWAAAAARDPALGFDPEVVRRLRATGRGNVSPIP